MKKPDIVKRLARQTGVTPAEAADCLDRAVHRILLNARRRRETPFPGLGKFTVGSEGEVGFERGREGGDE